MKRLLRLTAIVFGIGLIGMVGMLETMRHSHEADPVLLVTAGVNGLSHEALYLTGASSEIRQRISSPAYNFQVLRWWQHEQWLYLTANRNSEEFNTGSGMIWRIQRDNPRAEALSYASKILNVVATPDGKWLVYIAQDQNRIAHLFRLQTVLGAQPMDMLHNSENLDLSMVQPEVSANGQWVYFSAQQGSDSDFYRVSIDGGIPENLTAEIDAAAHLVIQTKDWLLFMSDAMLYITYPDGSNLHPLLSDSVGIDAIGSVWWLPEQNLLITGVHLQEGNQVWALELPEATLQWHHEDLSLFRPLTSDGLLIALDSRESSFYVRTDGSPPLPINPTGFLMDYSRNEPVIVRRNHYVGDHIPTDYFEFWQLLSDGTTRLVYQPVTFEAWIKGWSWDKKWVAIYDYEANSNQPHSIIVDTKDGKIYRREEWVKVISWLPPIDRAWSPIGLLVMGSVLMLGGVIRQRGKSTL